MAMQSSGSGTVSPDINVTPLIDVLLVLLIIFMVIVPQLPRGLDGAIPQDTASSQAAAPLRLEIAGDDSGAPLRYKLDQTEVSLDGLGLALQHAVARRQDKTLFLRAGRSLSYQQVATVMGIGHEAGAAAIVLEPESKP